MASDLAPEQVLKQLERGRLQNVYLFHGPDDFRMEKVWNRIRENFIPKSARDFNLHIFDAESQIKPGDILDAARSMPFLSNNRLVMVRRVDAFKAAEQAAFLPYLEDPVETTCLIFLTLKPDFRTKFFGKLRALGFGVHFRPLSERQALPWIRGEAKAMGLRITDDACRLLYEMVGNNSRALYMELEKLCLRYQEQKVGIDEIKESSIFSRLYSIFELMDEISARKRGASLTILNRYLEEEGVDAALGIIGMLNRQIRILIQAKELMARKMPAGQMSKALGVPAFLMGKIQTQARLWKTADLENALEVLYQADGRLKSGSQARLILENVVLSI